jgi:hypothetical protein
LSDGTDEEVKAFVPPIASSSSCSRGETPRNPLGLDSPQEKTPKQHGRRQRISADTKDREMTPNRTHQRFHQQDGTLVDTIELDTFVEQGHKGRYDRNEKEVGMDGPEASLEQNPKSRRKREAQSPNTIYNNSSSRHARQRVHEDDRTMAESPRTKITIEIPTKRKLDNKDSTNMAHSKQTPLKSPHFKETQTPRTRGKMSATWVPDDAQPIVTVSDSD